MGFIFDIFLDAIIDTLKILPFLFATYLLMEWLEHKTGTRTQAAIRKAGRTGPLLGGFFGIFPQCGFSAAASNFYSGGVITAGTLLAVYMSTSDEMLPIFISEKVSVMLIIKVLGTKFLLATISGFVLDFLYHRIIRKEIRYKNIHTMCESEHCKCEEGVLSSSIRHTLKIALFILIITFVLNGIIECIGEERLQDIVTGMPVLGHLLAGILGLIPNCAASVVITKMYLGNMLSLGAMMTGLLVSAGVGLLVLFKINKKHIKQNIGILVFLYLASSFWGIIIDLLGIKF